MAAVSDEDVRTTITELLDRRDGTTICPSDAARCLRPGGDWRALMDQVRAVAGAEARAGRLRVTRGGEPVDPRAPGGPIRLGRA